MHVFISVHPDNLLEKEQRDALVTLDSKNLGLLIAELLLMQDKLNKLEGDKQEYDLVPVRKDVKRERAPVPPLLPPRKQKKEEKVDVVHVD